MVRRRTNRAGPARRRRCLRRGGRTDRGRPRRWCGRPRWRSAWGWPRRRSTARRPCGGGRGFADRPARRHGWRASRTGSATTPPAAPRRRAHRTRAPSGRRLRTRAGAHRAGRRCGPASGSCGVPLGSWERPTRRSRAPRRRSRTPALGHGRDRWLGAGARPAR